MALVPLIGGSKAVKAYAVVDAADAEWVNRWRWHLSSDGYAVRTERVGPRSMNRKRRVRLHREVMGLTEDALVEVDHINRNKIDNRRSNLRTASRFEQMQNQPSNRGSTSQHRGVSWSSRDKRWVAQIGVAGKKYCLGRFSSEEEAARVAKEARQRLMPYTTN